MKKKKQDSPAPEDSTADGEEDLWACVGCSFLNHSLLSYCEICETPKKVEPEAEAEAGDFGGPGPSLPEQRRPPKPSKKPKHSRQLEAQPEVDAETEMHASGSAGSAGVAGSSAGGEAGAGEDASLSADAKLTGDEDGTTTWKCNLCSFANIALLPYCEMCEAPRPTAATLAGQAAGSSGGSRGQSSGSSGAGAAQSGTGSAGRPSEKAQEGRACPLCSFANAPGRSACEICEAPLTPRPRPDEKAPSAPKPKGATKPPPEPVVEKEDAEVVERRLLLAMGWKPDDEVQDSEGALEPWEIEAAQKSGAVHLKQRGKALNERAQRAFEAWTRRPPRTISLEEGEEDDDGELSDD
eukprot:gnl/TRDRNA2_/TRDRNA2_196829_c0_seq1.p1 gnl/TRDRNA2_/TRDRNA2_196829_c0~~gnl/TRDRNA2_/TRDRNA2_196829_c0_seq1.p1  ORF type:complete len:353 (+),score=92.50 gnl/TRDRNA2_/TRDRNA2_196829_c0_seq1:104-1162(+)